jgi:hypothetical protein
VSLVHPWVLSAVELLTPEDAAEDINPLHYAAALGDTKGRRLPPSPSPPNDSPAAAPSFRCSQSCAVLLSRATDPSWQAQRRWRLSAQGWQGGCNLPVMAAVGKGR